MRMDIYAELDAMRSHLRERAWLSLETQYRDLSRANDGPGAAAIEAVDLSGYQARLTDDLSRLSEAARLQPTAAVYWEFDVDNNWSSSFFLCPTYRPEADGDDDWAADFEDHDVVSGPDMTALARLYARSWNGSPAETARNLYLIARTLAAFGRAADAAWPGRLPLCVGYHDQTIVFRLGNQA